MSAWTPEREDLVRRLWKEGRSASEIAKEMGGLTRVAVIGKVHRMGLGRDTAAEISTRAIAKARMVCAFPGCRAGLYRKSVTGLCQTHTYAKGLCRCASCAGTAPLPRIAERSDVRVAEVPYPTSNSGVTLKARVSLPREPWVSP